MTEPSTPSAEEANGMAGTLEAMASNFPQVSGDTLRYAAALLRSLAQPERKEEP